MSEDFEPPGSTTDPLAIAGELLRVVPRFIDRTRNQVELAASLASRIPCVESVLGADDGAEDEPDPEEVQHAVAPNDRERVPVDVLSVLEADDTAGASVGGSEGDAEVVDLRPGVTGATAPSSKGSTANGSRPGAAGVPTESDLPIPDYDSLAAAHVVPRLATMSEADLMAVRDYEQAHRNRRTILNRIAQRLES